MMDKFKNQKALQKAYESLEKEFTRRSQQLRELQGKIERLTTENKKLTEENRVMERNLDFHRNKKFELQQQADKLKEENTELHKERTILIAGSILKKEDTIKDTANEILTELDLFFKGTTFKKGYEFKKIDAKLKEIATRNGVEVE